jgi:hypothetical protein
MTSTRSEVRAVHLQTLHAALEAFGPERARSISAALHPQSAARVRRAGRLEWIPAELLVELCEVARAVAGDADLERWGGAAFEHVRRMPLMRGFYEAALVLGGRRPAPILTGFTHAWPLLYRGVGELIVTSREPGLVRIVHADVPPIVRNPATVLPLVGALGAVPGHCGLEGGHAVAEWTTASPCFVYTVRWTALAAS